ncbi:hypothetical protein [Vibrio diazotrophicus]|uniref:hypothetical protein n=1 Tax=Vibrio diazotrophicus TaxID=685 RepID=UPI000C9E3BC7|nr:hypothetical protein [Vibrio diazotrophicus]PNH92279.1 hypothetical protein C1O24_20720 [Vibrio diazotrophicus]
MDNNEKYPALAQRQIWLYSASAAVSSAFFLALLSSGNSLDNSLLLLLSTILFAISLVTNAVLAFHGMAYNSQPVEMARQTSTIHVFKVQFCAYLSIVLAVLFLIWYFSFVAFLSALIAGTFSFYKLYDGISSNG